jgi:hypothetical protein
MIISTEALTEFEPLFVQFTTSMTLIREQHRDAFAAIGDQKILCSETLRVLLSYSIDRSRVRIVFL